MKKIRFLLPAEQEMFEAAAYYEMRVKNLGENFLVLIEAAVRNISESPERWPEIGFGIRKLILRRFPYSVLFRVDLDEIVIVAVMHQRQRPHYWSYRV